MTEEDNESELRHTDFNKAFEELYSCSHQLTIPGVNIRNTFEVKEIGKLVLTSGKLFACDPLMPLEVWELTTKRLNIDLTPGCYPIFISLLNLQAFNNKPKCQTVACTMLRLGNRCVVRWELAKCADNSTFVYGVDSGTGSFMDIDAAKYLCRLSWRERNIVGLYDVDLYNWTLDKEQERKNKNKLEENIIQQITQSRSRDSFGWANIQVRKEIGANIIVFDSGAGDGGYASYIGYDAIGNIVAVVTDFNIANFYLTSFEK